MASEPMVAYAQAAQIYMEQLWHYNGKQPNALYRSGFLNNNNMIYTNDSKVDTIEGAAINVFRTKGGAAYFRTDMLDVSTGGSEELAESKALFKIGGIFAGAAGTDASSSKSVLIPYGKWNNITGSALSITQQETVLRAAITGMYLNLYNAFIKNTIQLIDQQCWVKSDRDGENFVGVVKTFDQDTGRTPETWSVDLVTTSTTDAQKRSAVIAMLNKFRTNSGAALDLMESGEIITLLVTDYLFDQLYPIMNPIEKEVYRGVENSDGSKYGYGTNYFTNSHYQFVRIPTSYFKTIVVGTAPEVTYHRIFMLPKTSIAVYNPATPVGQAINWNGKPVLSLGDVQNYLIDSNMATPQMFMANQDDALADPYLMAWKAQSGMDFSPNTARLLINEVGETNSSQTSDGLMLKLHSLFSVVRTQPQFIQEIRVDQAIITPTSTSVSGVVMKGSK